MNHPANTPDWADRAFTTLLVIALLALLLVVGGWVLAHFPPVLT